MGHHRARAGGATDGLPRRAALQRRAGSAPSARGTRTRPRRRSPSLRADPQQPNHPGWRVRVVPNRFPALRTDAPLEDLGDGLCRNMTGFGIHEVIIESPRHILSLNEMDDRRHPGRAAHLPAADPEPAAGQPVPVRHDFQERRLGGRRHGGAFAFPVDRHAGGADGRPHRGAPRAAIQRGGRRVPFLPHDRPGARQGRAGRPRRPALHRDRAVRLAVPVRDVDPADAARRPLRGPSGRGARRHRRVRCAPCSTGSTRPSRRPRTTISSTPRRSGRSPVNHYHWHIEIIPCITKIAGFEWGTGCYINPVLPESAAAFLREATKLGRSASGRVAAELTRKESSR